MEFPKSPTLGLLLFGTFISDPDDRTQTAFIKLTTNQLGRTANYIGGQKDKLEKWESITHRQEQSIAGTRSTKGVAYEKNRLRSTSQVLQDGRIMHTQYWNM